MNKIKKAFFAAALFTGAGISAQAQAVATASASATIVSPISIAKNTDMSFGNLSVSSSAGGSVTLAASAAATRTPSSGGGVSLPANTGTVSAAQFTVSGQANFTYAITLPSFATLLSGANAMQLENFTHNATGLLNGTGTETFYVGGELTVDADQAPGTYTTSAPFFVGVLYN